MDLSAAGDSGLKSGKLQHRLLSLLARDFYRPVPVAEAFYELFPGEHFNPVTSPHRVYEGIRRVRTWLRQQGKPLRITLLDGTYRLTAVKRLIISTNVTLREMASAPVLYARLAHAFPERPFTSDEAGKVLRVSGRSARRLLTDGVEAGEIVRERAGRTILYRIKGAATFRAA